MVTLKIAAIVAVSLSQPGRSPASDPRSERVDSVFAAVVGRGSAGCAAGVRHGGRLVHARGYGLADVEHAVPITPSTVFYLGSLSKQFTAMSIALLVRDGRISLDEPARRYLPEIPRAGAGITIRQMVHHMSGLREKWDLLQMGGFRAGNLLTQDDLLALVARQRELNFAPGTDQLYNNTAYDLLATLVQRVAGRGLPGFAAERIFAPLGMRDTRYVDDVGLLVPNRALGYSVTDAGARHEPAYVETVGSGGVYSTLEDLARWDESFASGALGGPDLLRLVQTPGRLSDGTQTRYAFGLETTRWRGLDRIYHSGALAGFRTVMMRFPQRNLSVIVLCNYAQADVDAFADRIAELYLGDAAGAAPDAAVEAVLRGDPALIRSAAGIYRTTRGSGELIRIEPGDSFPVLVRLGRRIPLRVGGATTPASGATLTLERVPGSAEPRVVLRGGEWLGTETFRRVRPAVTTPAVLAPLAGTYHSDELGVTWTLAVRNDTLFLRHDEREEPLAPRFEEGFRSSAGFITFEHGARGRVTALFATPGRSWNIRFRRVGAR